MTEDKLKKELLLQLKRSSLNIPSNFALELLFIDPVLQVLLLLFSVKKDSNFVGQVSCLREDEKSNIRLEKCLSLISYAKNVLVARI